MGELVFFVFLRQSLEEVPIFKSLEFLRSSFEGRGPRIFVMFAIGDSNTSTCRKGEGDTRGDFWGVDLTSFNTSSSEESLSLSFFVHLVYKDPNLEWDMNI